METCDLSWNLDTDTEEDVVFVVAGRDKAGMWSLITDSLTLTSLELSTDRPRRRLLVITLQLNILPTVSTSLQSTTPEH